MKSFFLMLFIVIFFNGCVVKKSYYGTNGNYQSRGVNKSTHNMDYKKSNNNEVKPITNPINKKYYNFEDYEEYEEIVYIQNEDGDRLYVTEEIIYIDNFDDYQQKEIIYYTTDENIINSPVIYTEEIIYYYEEEL